MDKIEIEKFIEATGEIYSSTVLAFKRARQLTDEGRKPTINVEENEKDTTIAIKEVAKGKVVSSKDNNIEVEE